jgi:hypothetical protein
MQRHVASVFVMLAVVVSLCGIGPGARAAAPDTDRLLPENFAVYVLGNGVVNWPAPGSRPTTLTTRNLYRGPRGGYIACYSHNAAGSAYGVGGKIYVMGQVRLRGDYDGRIFQPDGYRGADIGAAPHFKQVCGEALAACRAGDCWAGGDTGGWFGVR